MDSIDTIIIAAVNNRVCCNHVINLSQHLYCNGGHSAGQYVRLFVCGILCGNIRRVDKWRDYLKQFRLYLRMLDFCHLFLFRSHQGRP
jgi:limonene-1,2-epoxide hydrolase